MRMAETAGQFKNAAARKVHRNDDVSIGGNDLDQRTADSACRSRYDDDPSCLLHMNLSAASVRDIDASQPQDRSRTSW
ncbi:hypothetical protein [Mesorhizobium sp. L-2-11]|uniref:hypothetical protein n=1 Tax=Mesorhizobium sp. L-2-11 TaxID=2744521 RepID=UPI0002BD62FE|nr:hypothetical protein [Mesorhizobium sp. L-2-11]CCV13756.1 hypothetical protein MESS4_60019 [Mesorhizobium sp. STM 4661]